MTSEHAIILISVGTFMTLWTVLMGDRNHWNTFERFGAKIGPLIGAGIVLMGIIIWWWQ